MVDNTDDEGSRTTPGIPDRPCGRSLSSLCWYQRFGFKHVRTHSQGLGNIRTANGTAGPVLANTRTTPEPQSGVRSAPVRTIVQNRTFPSLLKVVPEVVPMLPVKSRGLGSSGEGTVWEFPTLTRPVPNPSSSSRSLLARLRNALQSYFSNWTSYSDLSPSNRLSPRTTPASYYRRTSKVTDRLLWKVYRKQLFERGIKYHILSRVVLMFELVADLLPFRV